MQVSKLNDTELVSQFYLVAVEITKRANSSRGIPLTLIKREESLTKEVSKRFNLDLEYIKEIQKM